MVFLEIEKNGWGKGKRTLAYHVCPSIPPTTSDKLLAAGLLDNPHQMTARMNELIGKLVQK